MKEKSMILKNLNVDDIKNISLDTLIEAYRNGYIIEESSSKKITSLASCPSSIQQGTTKTITITPSGGAPPYKYELIVDGVVVYMISSATGTQTFNFIFNQSIGIHTYQSRITDSCTNPGPQIISDTPCSINITSEAPPPPPPPTTCLEGEIPILGQCYPKNYLAYAGIGFIGLLILTRR